MIAKITRGTRAGEIAAYLHGPGKANEHQYTKDHIRQRGGRAIGGNLGREGETDGARWAQDLRDAAYTREDIPKPIWQVSLRTAPGDRKLSDQEWADLLESLVRYRNAHDPDTPHAVKRPTSLTYRDAGPAREVHVCSSAPTATASGIHHTKMGVCWIVGISELLFL